jgi:hypothetical protein
MRKRVKIYNLGIIPIEVRTKKDCKMAGELVQKMAIKAINEKRFIYEKRNIKTT